MRNNQKSSSNVALAFTQKSCEACEFTTVGDSMNFEQLSDLGPLNSNWSSLTLTLGGQHKALSRSAELGPKSSAILPVFH